jgi:hypothetical protein
MSNQERDPHQKSSGMLGFEREDMNPRVVVAFLLGLALVGVLIHFSLHALMGYIDSYVRTHQPAKSPMVAKIPDTRVITPSDINKFPEPRLETDEANEIFPFRAKEEQELNSYGWVDQQAGIVHIPIERAMDLIAQRGLPTTPQAGTAPSSEVNMVNQAAQRSDTSGGSTGLETTGAPPTLPQQKQKGKK